MSDALPSQIADKASAADEMIRQLAKQAKPDAAPTPDGNSDAHERPEPPRNDAAASDKQSRDDEAPASADTQANDEIDAEWQRLVSGEDEPKDGTPEPQTRDETRTQKPASDEGARKWADMTDDQLRAALSTQEGRLRAEAKRRKELEDQLKQAPAWSQSHQPPQAPPQQPKPQDKAPEPVDVQKLMQRKQELQRKVYEDGDDWNTVSGEIAEIDQKMAEHFADQRFAALQQQQIARQQQLEQQQAQAEYASFLTRLDDLVPGGIDANNADPAFQDWANRPDPSTGLSPAQVIQFHAQSQNAEAIANIVRQFHASNGSQSAPAPAPSTKPDLASQVTPKTSAASRQRASEGQTSTLKTSMLAKYRQDLAGGRLSPEAQKRVQSIIDRHIDNGTVVPG